MITFKQYLEEAKPTKVAQFHGSDGTSVNVYARGDKHFAEITTKTGSNVSASSVFPNGSNADAQSKLDHVVLHTKKKNHKGALDILNQHSHLQSRAYPPCFYYDGQQTMQLHSQGSPIAHLRNPVYHVPGL